MTASKLNLHRFLLTALLALAFAGPSHAAVLFSTLGQPVSASATYTPETVRFGSDFLTDGNPNTITHMTALMGNNSTFIDLTVTFSIYTDNGSGKPGTQVGTFVPVVVGSGGSGFFTAEATSSGIGLLASTLYWVVGQVSGESVGSVNWRYNMADNEDAGSSFSIVLATQIQRSADGGASYADFSPGNLLFALQGDITPIPEPTGLAFLVFAGAFGAFTVIGWWRRRRVALASLPERAPRGA